MEESEHGIWSEAADAARSIGEVLVDKLWCDTTYTRDSLYSHSGDQEASKVRVTASFPKLRSFC